MTRPRTKSVAEGERALTEQGFVACLLSVLVDDEPCCAVFDPSAVVGAETFEDAGVLTRNHGLVVRMADGSEFQLTVVRSKPARQ